MQNKNGFGATKKEWLHFDLIMGLSTELLPVVSNPHAEISPNSKMKKKGKTPSIYNRMGKVAGLPSWTGFRAQDKDITKWMETGDYGICIQTRYVRAIDIDVADPQRAAEIVKFIEDFLGIKLPVRVRANSGKCLIAFIVEGDFPKRQVPVEGGIIEYLANGQQFVAAGTHETLVRIEWRYGLPDEFPVINADLANLMWAAVCGKFGIAPPSVGKISARRKGDDLGLADHILDKLDILDFGKGGQAYITCPFEHEHTTDSGITATAYFPRGTAGYEQGHFVCLHAHCSGRSDTDFLDALGIRAAEFTQLPSRVETVNAVGEVVAMLPWPNLKRNKAGMIMSTLPNLEKVLMNPEYCGYDIRYDAYRGEIVFAPFGGVIIWRALTDNDYTELRTMMEKRGFMDISREKIRDVVANIAIKKEFDSAQEWEKTLTWDGIARIETFYIDFFGAEDSEYTRGVGLYTWSAMVARILDPGCQADMVPIIEGEQGILKSSALAAMVPSRDCFCEISFNESEDQITRKLRGRMLAEIGEMRGLHTRELESIKALIVRRVDLLIEKYKEFAKSYKRRALFIGTTNKKEFLADETGNRRWLPMHVIKADIENIKKWRDQLWAEAGVYYRKHGIAWQVEKIAAAEHDKYTMRDSWEESIGEYLHREEINGIKPIDKEFITMNEIVKNALNMEVKHAKNNDQWRIAKILRMMGFTSKRMRVDGQMSSVWMKIA